MYVTHATSLPIVDRTTLIEPKTNQAVIRSFSDARASHAAGGVYELEPQSPNEKDADQ